MLKLRMMADRDASTIPWTKVYGLARTALTISTLITLIFQISTQLFAPAGPAAWPEHSGIHALDFFLVFARGSNIPGGLARIAAIVGLLVALPARPPSISGSAIAGSSPLSIVGARLA